MSRLLANGLNGDDAIKEAANLIVESSESLQTLVENMLILARLDQNKLQESLEPVHVGHLIRKIVEDHRKIFPHRDVSLDCPRQSLFVEGNAGWLQQVLRNFLTNAEKYAGRGAPVTVQVGHADGSVIVRVIDGGVGITEEQAEHLFDPFYRAPSTAGHAAGAGLGLAVSKRLIELQRGHVWARPAENVGAEFGFALPELQLDEDDPE
jgi:signal transduction histidine kinase